MSAREHSASSRLLASQSSSRGRGRKLNSEDELPSSSSSSPGLAVVGRDSVDYVSDNIGRNNLGHRKIYISAGSGIGSASIDRNGNLAKLSFQMEREMLLEQIWRKDEELLKRSQKIADLGGKVGKKVWKRWEKLGGQSGNKVAKKVRKSGGKL